MGFRIWAQDEAGFGRISEPYYCWCPPGTRPTVPAVRVREYRTDFGASDVYNGDIVHYITEKDEKCCSATMSKFLKLLSDKYPDDIHLVICDGAGWHKSKDLIIPENIRLAYIPPHTPEMNPQEQIWREVRTRGFKNTFFNSIQEVVDTLKNVMDNLEKQIVKTICGRDWLIKCFN